MHYRVRQWLDLLEELRTSREPYRTVALRHHRWILRHVEQREEIKDAWQTPEETLIIGAGDCDQFATLNYAAMRYVGLFRDQVYYSYLPGHAVCTVKTGADAWVADNLSKDLQPLDRYPVALAHLTDGHSYSYLWQPQDFWPALWESWLIRASELEGFEFLSPDMAG